MAVIAAENIRKVFDEKIAVDDVSFAVESGKIFGFLGPNGAGKTTTIRMVMNITMPDSGSVQFDGKPMSEALKKQIGYLPEERGLYPKMKVQPLLEFLGQLKGLSLGECRKAIDYWFDRFDIDSWRQKKLEELSKGMQQKIQFISTIMHDPAMVVLDEPFSGLDPVNVDVLRDIIVEMKKKGKIVFFSTHMMEKAEQLCDEIVLINNGKAILNGGLKEIKQRFSENRIDLEFEGDGAFLQSLTYLKFCEVDGNLATVELKEASDTAKLLKELADKVQLKRMNPREKSLHEIFVSQVGGQHA